MYSVLLSACLLTPLQDPTQASPQFLPETLVVDETPNLRIAVAHELANCIARQGVDRCDTFCETILGTRIRGLGRTVGQVNLEFIPSDHGAVVDLVMTGVNTPIGNNIGTNGPVVLITQGETLVAARKRLFIQPEGITTAPATADAVPESNLKRIDTHFHGMLDRLVRRVATNVYQRDRGEGVAIGRAIAVRKAAQGFDEDVNPRLEGWNRQIREEFREPLQKRGLYPERLHFLTDPGYLHILGRLTDARGYTPIGPPPPLPVGAHAAVWVHESLPNGQLARLLAGKKLTSEQINAELKKVLGEQTNLASPPPTQEKLEIEFTKDLPISVKFEGDTVSVTLRILSFTSGEDIYDGPNNRSRATVRYKLTLQDGQILATRPEVEVLPLDFKEGDRIGVRQLGVLGILKEQLEPLFRREIKEKSIFPAPPTVARRVGQFQVENLISQNGWLAVGIKGLPPVVK